MHIAILGRQPALGIAELEKVFGGRNVKVFSTQTVSIDCDNFDIQNLRRIKSRQNCFGIFWQ